MKRLMLIGLLTGSIFIALQAQDVYEVLTLLPEDSRLLDDGLALDENGTLYGAYWGIWQGAAGNHILRYRPDGSYDTLATGMIRPNGLSYQDGILYVANGGQNQLLAIDTTGQKEVLANIVGLSNVIPAADSGALLVISWGQNKVFRWDTSGQVRVISSSPLLNGPVGAALDSLGRLYIGNFNDGKIIRIGDSAELFADLGGGIGFLTHSHGAILATNHSDKRVYRIGIDSAQVEVLAGSGNAEIVDGVGEEASFRSPNGIVASPTGDTIYVSEFAGKALRMLVRQPINIPSSISRGENPSIQLFPLPSRGQLYLHNHSGQQLGGATLRDTSGRLVQQIPSSMLQSGQIDLRHLPDGHYILSIQDLSGNLIQQTQVPLMQK